MSAARPLPPPLPESGEASRFFDRTSGALIAKVLPGFFYVTKQPERLVTVLGSCISACIRDPLARVGGMNHFMLPSGSEQRAQQWTSDNSALNRYGNFAMENLINAIIKHGGSKSRLEVKLFGGGHVMDISSNVGQKNAHFAEQYLEFEGLALTSADVGGRFARKIIYDPISGKVKLKRLQEVFNGYVANQEKQLMQTQDEQKSDAGSVELF